MRTLAIIMLLSLTACGREMSREEVIQAVNECKAAGLDAGIVTNELTYSQSKVICLIQKRDK